MTYEVTAIRKRPQTFDELVGQDFIVATLKSSVLQGRIAHAYLFSGPRGVGKTSAARILAKALNCEQGPTDTPCGVCDSCRAIARGNALDVIEIDGASNTSVNDVRQIKDEVLFAPNSSRYKVYIIDEVHMLSNSAFNALLKTIEEPPPYIVFIFATTEVHKVPATIRSRCQQFNFRLISTDQIAAMLGRIVEEASLRAEDSALLWMAKEATGSLRDAYTLLDQVMSFARGAEAGAGVRGGAPGGADRSATPPDGGMITLSRIREKLGLTGVEQVESIGTIISQGDKKQTLERIDEVLASGVSVDQLVVDLTDYFRSLLFLKCGIDRRSLLAFSAQEVGPKVLEAFSVGQLEKAIEILLELYRRLKYSLHPRFELELAMCQLAGLRELILPSELLESIRTIKAELEGKGAAATVRGDALPPEDAGPGAFARGASASGGTSTAGGSQSGTRQPGTREVRRPQAGEQSVGRRVSGSSPTEHAGSRQVGTPVLGAQAVETRYAGTEPPGTTRGEALEGATGATPGGEGAAQEPAPSSPKNDADSGASDIVGDRLGQLVEAVRKDRLALASSLAKADRCEIAGDELRLHYKDRDRFSGEQILREKEAVLRRTQEVFPEAGVARVRIHYITDAPEAGGTSANQIEMVKKIFRGEIVEGE
jgi:DNA polymerase-3 subunit gamma/tau